MAKHTYDENDMHDESTESKKKGKKKRGKGIKRFFITLLVIVLLVVSLFAGLAAGFANSDDNQYIGEEAGFAGKIVQFLRGFSDDSMDMIAEEYNLDFTSIIYYVDKETNYPVEMDRVHRTENRVWVDIENLPENLPNAFIAIEDERFREHKGMDIKRTMGAFVQWVMGKDSYGGSTITQQLIKNITGDRDRSPIRKIQEIIRAVKLENKMSKDQIIEMYMNTIYFGEGCHGIQTASNHYFSKDASELTLEECATLAAIVKAPTTYNPVKNYENNKQRRDVVLLKMAELGMITYDEKEEAQAKETQIVIGETEDTEKSEVKSYFIDALINDVIADLMEAENLSESDATNRLYTGGFKIYSTYDPEIQAAIDKVYTKSSNFPNSSVQSAMVVMDPYTGHVKGMAGGVGEKTVPRGLNRATQSKRQPGSAFKPVAVYAPAIEYNVITAATLIKDAPLTIGNWSPKNSGGGYAGMVTTRRAIEKSYNIPAVKVLRELTPEKSFEFLTQKLGFTTLVENETRGDKQVTDQTLSSALGGLTDGVTVEEMTAAYSAFVNSGMYNAPTTYTKVIDSSGRVILENKVQNRRAMSEETAYIMTDMLSGVTTRGTGTGARLSGVFTAGKTGTTNSNKDRWFMGITPNYVAGVWMGYDQPKAMSGSNYCTSVFKKVMTEIYKNTEEKKIEKPQGVIKRTVCQSTGKLAGGSCPRVSDYFKEGTQPTKYCYSSHGYKPPAESNTDQPAGTVVPPAGDMPSGTPSGGSIPSGGLLDVILGSSNDTSSAPVQNQGATPDSFSSESDSESSQK